jgi:DNA gyrase inhibitor GyrI
MKMDKQLDVRIISLPALRVASFHAFSSSPEQDAWKKMESWAKPKGLLEKQGQKRIFGFNNPDPSPGSPNYGYEFWITVSPEVLPEAGVQIKEFSGGLYAVTRCEVGDPGDDIYATWQKLVAWLENSSYKHGMHQWLEEHLFVEIPGKVFVLDLFLPIVQ